MQIKNRKKILISIFLSLFTFNLNLNAEEFNPIDVMLEALEPIKLDYTNLKPELEIDYNKEV